MSRTVLIGILGAILLIAALLLALTSGEPGAPTPDSGQEEAVETPTTDDPDGTAPDASSDGDGTRQEAEAETEEDGSAPPSDPATDPGTSDPDSDGAGVTPPPSDQDTAEGDASGPIAPSFDIVRIDRTGDAVIAGRAEPGADVRILDNGEPLGAAVADERGEWVYLPESALPPGAHELTLNSILPDGREVPGKGSVVVIVPNPGQDVAGRETDDPEAQNPVVVLIPDRAEPGAEVIQAPTAGEDDAPLAAPSDTAEPGGVASEDGQLSIETVDYDSKGNISIAGDGPAGAAVLAYLDDGLIGSAPVTTEGRWRISPDQTVAPGVYTLRLDALAGGAVIARLELPFSRAAPLDDLQGDAFVIVQPGNSLWRIARRTMGSGFSYTVIYQANADQIVDPDLIYPGQVFEIPTR